MSKLININPEYQQWIGEVAKRFRQSQIRAAVRVNNEMLRFYWTLGRDLSRLHLDATYGSNFYKSVSDDLHDIFPEVHSFSPTNLKYMRYFYELYPNVDANHQQVAEKSEIRPQPEDESPMHINRPQHGDDLFTIPWSHHKLVIDKCKGNQAKALFYLNSHKKTTGHVPCC